MPGSSDPLNTTARATGQPDLHRHVGGSNIDAELQACAGDDRAKPT